MSHTSTAADGETRGRGDRCGTSGSEETGCCAGFQARRGTRTGKSDTVASPPGALLRTRTQHNLVAVRVTSSLRDFDITPVWAWRGVAVPGIGSGEGDHGGRGVWTRGMRWGAGRWNASAAGARARKERWYRRVPDPGELIKRPRFRGRASCLLLATWIPPTGEAREGRGEGWEGRRVEGQCGWDRNTGVLLRVEARDRSSIHKVCPGTGNSTRPRAARRRRIRAMLTHFRTLPSAPRRAHLPAPGRGRGCTPDLAAATRRGGQSRLSEHHRHHCLPFRSHRHRAHHAPNRRLRV
ncbi:hypothetical protein DFH07DRAFT_374028 [Mycena maculata]|uniref:Uncharacterized protein n=1 Tax=Mycena maculata TaxID=230809 RepID=A0AAD7H825_9AGAR|nr:hypothetical protein DFH07DRAFT_374028 [Mycena maculata]